MRRPPYFIKKIILTNHSRSNDSPILAPKQQNVAIFGKTDFLGLKYPHHDHHDRGDHYDHGNPKEAGGCAQGSWRLSVPT